MKESVSIPMDIYESSKEIVIVIPLGGVERSSIDLQLEDYKLILKWTRTKPALKESFHSIKEECFWGEFRHEIQVPPTLYFEHIHSKLSNENVLTIILPKALMPEQMKVNIEYM